MSHKCKISGVALQSGNKVSHANNKTRRVFKANLQTKKIYVESLKKSVRLKVSTRVIRTIDRLGFEATLRKYNLNLSDIVA